MTDEGRKIIEKEIERLKKAYDDAQERYAYSGSASTDRTMYKYQVLQSALEESLADPSDEEDRLRRIIDDLYTRIAKAEHEIMHLVDARELMPGFGSQLKMILEGKR